MDDAGADGPHLAVRNLRGGGKGGIPSRTSIQGPPEGYRLILN